MVFIYNILITILEIILHFNKTGLIWTQLKKICIYKEPMNDNPTGYTIQPNKIFETVL
jgi:hypothetical protein